MTGPVCLVSILAGVWAAAALHTGQSLGGELASPREWLGFDPTGPGAVVDCSQVYSYLRHAASTCAQVRLEAAGLSTEGRPILCAIVSSADNLRRLDSIRDDRTRTFILVTCGVHPLEVGSTAASLPLLHRLLTGMSPRAREILAGNIILLVPCMNPDGTDRVAEWLRREGRNPADRPPFLQHRFAGHDLNRDWLLGTQTETRALIDAIHNRFRPWATIDLHQMEQRGPRIFVPPYAEPADPAIAPDLLAMTEGLGHHVLEGLTRGGRRGAACRWTYDAWTAARAYPFYHGGLRFLLEAAAARFAQPIEIERESLRVFDGANDPSPDHPAPWPGGTWTLRQGTEYLVAATELALAGLVEEPFRSGQARHLAGPSAEPAVALESGGADPAVLAGVLEALRLGGARLESAVDGRWIASDPGWGRGWCRTLLLCREYPAAGAGGAQAPVPYDTTTHDLAHLAGLRARESRATAPGGERDTPRSASLLRPGSLTGPIPAAARSWVVGQGSLALFPRLADITERGVRVRRITRAAAPAGLGRPGDFLILDASRSIIDGLVAAGADGAPQDLALPGAGAETMGLRDFAFPRLLVVTPREPSSDEGWLRWILEEYRFRFASIAEADLDRIEAAGGPRTTVLVPDGGAAALSLAGAAALGRVAAAGARVIAFGRSAREIARAASLSVEEAGAALAIPGTLLHTRFGAGDARDPVLWGYATPPSVFYSGGVLWKPGEESGVEALLTIDPDTPRACGRLLPAEAEAVRGAVAVLRARRGADGGECILFGFSPHYRAWTLGTLRLLFNAILAP